MDFEGWVYKFEHWVWILKVLVRVQVVLTSFEWCREDFE